MLRTLASALIVLTFGGNVPDVWTRDRAGFATAGSPGSTIRSVTVPHDRACALEQKSGARFALDSRADRERRTPLTFVLAAGSGALSTGRGSRAASSPSIAPRESIAPGPARGRAPPTSPLNS